MGILFLQKIGPKKVLNKFRFQPKDDTRVEGDSQIDYDSFSV